MHQVHDPARPSKRIDLGSLSSDLSFLARVLNAHIRWANAEASTDNDMLNVSAALLGVIAHNPGVSQNDLALTVVLKKSAVTKLVNELEHDGLVIRDKPRSDRRFNAVRLSAAGEKRWSDLQVHLRRQQDLLLAPLTETERDVLFDLLGRLVDHFSDGLSGKTSGSD